MSGGCKISSRPVPLEEVTNAFQEDWNLTKGYGKPPLKLVGTVLLKVEEPDLSGASMAVITILSPTAGTTGYQVPTP